MQVLLGVMLFGCRSRWTAGLSGGLFALALAGCFTQDQPDKQPASGRHAATAVAATEAPFLPQAQVEELGKRISEWKESSSKLELLVNNLDQDRLNLLQEIKQQGVDSPGEAAVHPRAKVLLDELRDVLRQQANFRKKNDDYDLAIFKSESRLRTIERRIAAHDAGISDAELEDLTRSMIVLDESLSTESEAELPAELDQMLNEQLAKSQSADFVPEVSQETDHAPAAVEHHLSNSAPPALPPVGQVTILKGHKHYVWSVAFSPDGRRLVSVSQDGPVILWDTATWRQLWSVVPTYRVMRAVGFSADSRQVLLYYFAGVQMLDANSGETHKQFDFWENGWGRFSPDGKWLIVKRSSDDRGAVYSIQDGKLRHEIKRSLARDLAYSTNSRYAYYGKHEVFRLDLTTMTEKPLGIKRTRSMFEAFAVSADSKYLAIASGLHFDGRGNVPGDQDVRVFDLGTTRPVARLTGHGGTVMSVCFLPDGNRLLSGGSGQPPDDYGGHRPGNDNSIRLWRFESETELHRFEGHEAAIYTIACSPDGKYAATGSGDATVRIWRLPD